MAWASGRWRFEAARTTARADLNLRAACATYGTGGFFASSAVPAGSLQIEAAIDWGRIRLLRIEAAAHQTIEIEVSRNWSNLLSLWAITSGKNTYLKLTTRPTTA
jgi:hypothetical protein